MDSYGDQESGQSYPQQFPVSWVGIYIAAGSLICAYAMTADVDRGISRKVLWFPCKYFTMNAASLTLLAVATRLSVDVTTAMNNDETDRMAKLSSTIFVTTAMGNFLTSFASMDSNAILINIAALGILVITVFVDGSIQIFYGDIYPSLLAEEVLVLLSMLFLFVTLSFSALTVPTTKRYLELEYGELHKKVYNGRTLEETLKLTNQELKEVVKKYSVMAGTSNPQFVMARSVTSATSGVICLLTVGILSKSMVRDISTTRWPHKSFVSWGLEVSLTSASDYKKSTRWILGYQLLGVIVGSVAPLFRWFTAINLDSRNIFSNWHLNTLILVENYRIQGFVECKERPFTLNILGLKFRHKLIQKAKNLFMNLYIGVQYGIVVVNKVVQFISVIILILPLYACYKCYKRLSENCRSERREVNENPASDSGGSPNRRHSEHETLDPELDLIRDSVLLLEGEVEIPARILKNICHEVNKIIQNGTRWKPKNLTELLRKSNDNFKGVVDFDSSEDQNCWALPVVTLTSIAFALPNIAPEREWLKSSVSEGLDYIKNVEKSFTSKRNDLLGVKNAADVTWGGVFYSGKWLDEDLRKLASSRKTNQEIIQTLVDKAARTIPEYEGSITESSKVLAAKSMHRISQTILKDYESNTDARKDEKLFEQLSIMIADIVGACLTNLPLVIARKCYDSPIEEREQSVRNAAFLLGQTEDIMEILRKHQLPSLSGDRAAYIDEWRAFMNQTNPPLTAVSSNNERVAFGSGELHLVADETHGQCSKSEPHWSTSIRLGARRCSSA